MTPEEQLIVGMLSAYAVAVRIVETSTSLPEACARLHLVWTDTRKIFDGEVLE